MVYAQGKSCYPLTLYLKEIAMLYFINGNEEQRKLCQEVVLLHEESLLPGIEIVLCSDVSNLGGNKEYPILDALMSGAISASDILNKRHKLSE